MCGIIGAFNSKSEITKLQTALGTMRHRGPDASGTFVSDEVFLGHQRLAIIDLDERANQPFCQGDLIMIYNGEVYNYRELIEEHQLEMRTTSDTEVVLQMFVKYGPDCVQYFNGMFAFIIYNKKTKEKFVVRDRLGIKPLYYYASGEAQIFSSEMRALTDLVDDTIDDFGVRQYLKLRMCVKDDTIYQKIKTFPAAHYYWEGRLHRYWDLDVSPKRAPSDEELKELIESAVALRKRADVPVGTYLSGGLDSTIVTEIAKPTQTWTVGFEQLNEFSWAREAAELLGTDHTETLIDPKLFKSTAEWMIQKRREPLSVPNEVLLYLMTEKVAEKNKVIISGEGADELFYGYDRIFKWAHESTFLGLREFDEKYCYGSQIDDEVLAFALEGIPGETVLEKINYYMQVIHLQGLLRRLDNSTMLCSVEARVPFVDHRLVERLAGVPFEWKMGNSFKEPLKRVFGSRIPESIVTRPKIGFPVPLKDLNLAQGETPMDQWLNFNMENLRTLVA